MIMSLVDLLAVSILGSHAIAVSALAHQTFGFAMVAGIGLLAGLDFPMAREAERNPKSLERWVGVGVWYAILLSVPLGMAIAWTPALYPWFGIHSDLHEEAREFSHIIAWSLPSVLLFQVFRQGLATQGRAQAAMEALIVANLINALLNWMWVRGAFGVTPVGLLGSGYATLVSRAFMVLWVGVAFYSRNSWCLNTQGFREVLKLGVPAACQMTFEMGVFTVASWLAARFDAAQAAAHQLVLQMASVLFMFPLGISGAAAILVARAIGAKNFALARAQGRGALLLGVIFMMVSSSFLLLFGEFVLGLFTPEASTMNLALSLLSIVLLFQLADATQVIATGCLRGLGDTFVPALVNLIGHWGIGLPIGYYLAFTRVPTLGVRGLWIGLATGLVIVAVTLYGVWEARVRRSRIA
jgi:MATE family multidrug resistance protein